MLDRLTVAGIVADRAGTVVYANDAVESLLGRAAADHAEFGPADDIAVLVLGHP